ncbi:MAG: hypothetical protein WCY09_08175 [Candidatus Omnitrophota bacterium]
MELNEPTQREFPDFIEVTVIEPAGKGKCSIHRDSIAAMMEEGAGTSIYVYNVPDSELAKEREDQRRGIKFFARVKETHDEIRDKLDGRVCAGCGLHPREQMLWYVSHNHSNHWLCSECKVKVKQ